jgi:DNA gyrase subunit B
LIHLEVQPWTLTIQGREKSITSQGILSLIEAINTMSKPFLQVQRYKGLGEMNPEQLWETSMDGKQRQLLKVSIEDALEADRWFTTLMGDDVAGRKDYIEKYGQFARNLDV